MYRLRAMESGVSLLGGRSKKIFQVGSLACHNRPKDFNDFITLTFDFNEDP